MSYSRGRPFEVRLAHVGLTGSVWQPCVSHLSRIAMFYVVNPSFRSLAVQRRTVQLDLFGFGLRLLPAVPELVMQPVLGIPAAAGSAASGSLIGLGAFASAFA